MKKVSVIIPVYMGEKFIEESLECVFNQTYKNIEIIVVYDKSEDKTLERLEKYKEKIILIKQPEKTKLSIARNVGIKHASGEFIAFLDADDLMHPKRIELQVKLLKENPEVGLCYTYVANIDKDGFLTALREQVPWIGKMEKYWYRRCFIAVSSVMARKSLLEAAGLFDEKLPFVEDFDFWLRLRKMTKFMAAPKYLTFYRHHKGQMSRDKRAEKVLSEVLKRHNLKKPKGPRFINLWIFIIRFIEKYLIKDHKYYTGEPLREIWKREDMHALWEPGRK